MITTTFLAWLYLFRNGHFPFVRNMFLVAMGLALIGYAAFPTAPPRMLPGEGFTDTIATYTAVDQDSNAVSLLVNKYAAVPSMHIGFALMIAGTAMAIVANRARASRLGALSAARLRRRGRHRNHYWLDAAAGAAVAAAAAFVAHRCSRRFARPGRSAARPTREASAVSSTPAPARGDPTGGAPSGAPARR